MWLLNVLSFSSSRCLSSTLLSWRSSQLQSSQCLLFLNFGSTDMSKDCQCSRIRFQRLYVLELHLQVNFCYFAHLIRLILWIRNSLKLDSLKSFHSRRQVQRARYESGPFGLFMRFYPGSSVSSVII